MIILEASHRPGTSVPPPHPPQQPPPPLCPVQGQAPVLPPSSLGPLPPPIPLAAPDPRRQASEHGVADGGDGAR